MKLVWTPEVLVKNQNLNVEQLEMYLSDISSNVKVAISNNQDMSVEFLRLAEMGFIPGTRVNVLRNDGSNPLIIEAKNIKLMLARKLAEKIRIEMD